MRPHAIPRDVRADAAADQHVTTDRPTRSIDPPAVDQEMQVRIVCQDQAGPLAGAIEQAAPRRIDDPRSAPAHRVASPPGRSRYWCSGTTNDRRRDKFLPARGRGLLHCPRKPVRSSSDRLGLQCGMPTARWGHRSNRGRNGVSVMSRRARSVASATG